MVIRGSVSSSQHPSAALFPLSLCVNGEVREVAGPATVASLLGELGLTGQRIAVAVNREVVPRSAHATYALRTDDRVEILEAVGGG